MNTSDTLISFETAKLAKEKGFDWKNIEILEVKSKSAFLDSTTQSLLQKWLREVHNIHLSIWYNNLTEKWRIDYIRNIKTDHDFTTNEDEFDTYELALEESLKQALNLIKNE